MDDVSPVMYTKPWLSSVIAGAHSPDQVKANGAAASWKLTHEEVAAVEAMAA